MASRHRRTPTGWAGLIALLVAATLATACTGAGPAGDAGPVWKPSAHAPHTFDGNWPTFDGDSARSGANSGETAITPGTVSQLHRLWAATLPEVADSTPILLHDLALPDGLRHDVLYLTTRAGSLVALDAATGAQLWVARTAGPHLTNASPVSDPPHAYVYSYGLDGLLHRYRATTGAEVTGGIWPVTITRMTATEKESSALNADGGYVYVTTSGYVGDAPPYQGHVVAIDLAGGRAHVFNTLCADRTHVLAPGECPEDRSGVWARAGVVVDSASGNLFVTTGNGPFDANLGGHDWGDSVLELSEDGSHLVDSYTPASAAGLERRDADLGSASPALLPAIPRSRTPYLAVQASKDSLLRLLNRQNLSGQGGPGHVGGELQTIATPGSCPVLTQPAVWTDASGAIWLFVTDGCALGGYQAVTTDHGDTTLRQVWSVPHGATSPIVAGGVLFTATQGQITALDPHTGRQLWSSADPAAGGTIGGIHWESPIVVGGRLYCSDESGQLSAYGL